MRKFFSAIGVALTLLNLAVRTHIFGLFQNLFSVFCDMAEIAMARAHTRPYLAVLSQYRSVYFPLISLFSLFTSRVRHVVCTQPPRTPRTIRQLDACGHL